jgi:hypothetical protein
MLSFFALLSSVFAFLVLFSADITAAASINQSISHQQQQQPIIHSFHKD